MNLTKKFFFNKDYEPYAIARDEAICQLLDENKIVSFFI
jgi:deoxyribodipyrimidine photo-lyase